MLILYRGKPPTSSGGRLETSIREGELDMDIAAGTPRRSFVVGGLANWGRPF